MVRAISEVVEQERFGFFACGAFLFAALVEDRFGAEVDFADERDP